MPVHDLLLKPDPPIFSLALTCDFISHRISYQTHRAFRNSSFCCFFVDLCDGNFSALRQKLYQGENLPYTVERNEDGIYVVEGPKIEKMLGYTNLDSEKGFQFFQKFLKDSGILAELEEAGIEEGDTVRMYGLEFDYYK